MNSIFIFMNAIMHISPKIYIPHGNSNTLRSIFFTFAALDQHEHYDRSNQGILSYL